jgi:CMP-N-acetylneuraminic acid synthetase
MEILAIIPARGGSKSIPRKNLKLLGGKPLIAWGIESALKSNANRVLVTTDDEEIAAVAKKYGADVPFIRPAELAGDTIGMEPVLKHTIEWLKENEGYEPDGAALLQSTCPLRQSSHINEAIEIFSQKITEGTDCVIGVSQAIANLNPEWQLKYDETGRVALGTGAPLTAIKKRRQELMPSYIRNDIIYLFKPSVLWDAPNLHGNNPTLYVVKDLAFDMDINTLADWEFAELIFAHLKAKGMLP